MSKKPHLNKVLTRPTIGFALLFFLMNYCSMYSIQSIGKVSKLPTNSKKSGNGANKIKKKSAVSKTLSNYFILTGMKRKEK